MVILGAICQGILYSIMAIGLFISFRILNRADLTVEGSFTLGAAIGARLVVEGFNPWLTLLIATVGGALAGMITGLLQTKFKIHHLLAGILTMSGLYSINLRILGKPNISLLRLPTIFNISESLSKNNQTIIVGSIIVIILILLLWLFFKTEFGYALRATGDNEAMIRAMGLNTNTMQIIGLMISNALVAICGSIIAQYNGYADIGMGVGMVVVALASLIIGEVLLFKERVVWNLCVIVIGSIIYRLMISLVLQLGFATDDFRLLTAIIVTIALTLPSFNVKNILHKLGGKNNVKD